MVVYNLIRNLDKKRFGCLICCLDKVGDLGDKLKDEGVEVVCLNRQPGTDWGLIGRLKDIIKTKQIDLVHVHQYTAYFYGGLASILA